mmetsp:Transcript_18057/g.56557  ORF Transcript_18057/g.56557 Transcript_18057/m.56557 type:complete len:372 (-) Transcript_18057:251-1366(-)
MTLFTVLTMQYTQLHMQHTMKSDALISASDGESHSGRPSGMPPTASASCASICLRYASSLSFTPLWSESELAADGVSPPGPGPPAASGCDSESVPVCDLPPSGRGRATNAGSRRGGSGMGTGSGGFQSTDGLGTCDSPLPPPGRRMGVSPPKPAPPLGRRTGALTPRSAPPLGRRTAMALSSSKGLAPSTRGRRAERTKPPSPRASCSSSKVASSKLSRPPGGAWAPKRSSPERCTSALKRLGGPPNSPSSSIGRRRVTPLAEEPLEPRGTPPLTRGLPPPPSGLPPLRHAWRMLFHSWRSSSLSLPPAISPESCEGHSEASPAAPSPPALEAAEPRGVEKEPHRGFLPARPTSPSSPPLPPSTSPVRPAP